MFNNDSWLRRAAAFFVPCSSPFGAHAALPAGITQGPSGERITEYKLANGLTVLLFPDASKPTTVVNVTYRVGAAHENYGETGMAHLLAAPRVQGHARSRQHHAGAGPPRHEISTAARAGTVLTTSRRSLQRSDNRGNT